MIGCNGFLCLLLLLVLPPYWGSLGQYVWQHDKQQNSIGGFTLTGWLIFLAGFELLAVFAAIRGWGLHRLVILTGVLVCTLLLVSLAAGLFIPSYRGFVREKLAQIITSEGLKVISVFVISFVCIAAIYVLRGFRLEIYRSVPEEVTATLADGALYRTNPLTGLAGVSVTMSDRLYQLPTLYAVIAAAFGLRSEVILFRIFPCVWLAVFLLAVLYAAEVFFEKTELRCIMLLAFVPVILCGSGAYMNVPYDILCAPYEAGAVMGAYLLPFLFALLLQSLQAICEGAAKGMIGKGMIAVLLFVPVSLMSAGVARGLLPVCMEVVLFLIAAGIVRVGQHFGARYADHI